jgi:drug/metabolite transporter (DMT)-like permease
MGEIAALATSFFWSFTSIQFTLAGRRVGSVIVNRVRLVLAVLFLSLAHFLLQGELWPIHAEAFRWGWLGLSGIIGLVLGDASLFQSFVLIGPRRAMLLMTLVPVIGALVAWVWLGETLRPAEIAAVLLTVSGIAWVVSERGLNGPQGAPVRDASKYALGVLLGLGGALGQALGLVTSKQGLSGDFSPLSATLIRMVVAAVVIWLLTLARGQGGATLRALEDKKARSYVVGGALTGPVFGVWMSMVAVQRAQVGIASTLMALSPIILIPFERRFFEDQISPRAIVGTVVALAGVAIIFLT